jgi:glycerol-3-phosphate dehydrogenase (NAD(P)+)
MGLQIGVLGLGAWGSTLADLLADQGHRIQSWSRRQGGDPAQVLAGADLVLAAVSMAGVRSLSRALAPSWPEGLPLVSCSKGIDLEQGATPSQLWQQQNPSLRVLVLSGPNLAQELAQGLPAASVLASGDDGLARGLQQALRSDRLRLYTNSDPIGTEVAGALKNVMAIAAGVSDGLGLGANAKASLLCRALLEMGSVIQALGGQPASLYGLAGLGDLLATANSPLSRNYRFGLQLAQGCSATEALQRVGGTVEGVPTAQAVQRLACREGWHLPISHQVAALIAGELAPLDAVRQLMERELKAEGLPQLARGGSLP